MTLFKDLAMQIPPRKRSKDPDGRLGNQFWKLRSKHGRDRLFKTPELLWEAACQYFEWCDQHPWHRTDYKGKDAIHVTIPTARPYTLSGLCIYLGCNTQYFAQFKASLPKEEKDFSLVITRIEQTIFTQKLEGAAVGAFNANIIARDLGLTDKKDHSSTDGTMAPKPNIIVSDQKTAEELQKLIDKSEEKDK